MGSVRIKTPWRRALLFSLGLLPLAWVTMQTIMQQLGADPAQTIVHFTGQWSLYFLFFTLAVTPGRRLFHWNWLAPHRRMLGLFSLFYGLLHLLAYTTFLLGFDIAKLVSELIKRPYITAGAPALFLMIVLGVTSTQKMMKRLGSRWHLLHQAIYLVAILIWIHVFWQVRASYRDALIYGGVIVILLGVRVYWYFRKSVSHSK